MIELVGLFAPLPAPFTDDGASLSEVRHARLMRRLIDQGVDGFVVGTEIGEFPALAHSERKTLVEWTLREAQGRPVIAHVSALSTLRALDLAQHASRHGARAVVLTPPFFGEFTLDEVVGFYRAVAQYGDIPVLAVDPFEDCGGGLRQCLLAMPSVWEARSLVGVAPELAIYGLAQPEEFAIAEAICTPLATLVPVAARASWREGAPPPAGLRDLLRGTSTMRVVKAAFAHWDLELGAHRGPAGPLDTAHRASLEQALASAA